MCLYAAMHVRIMEDHPCVYVCSAKACSLRDTSYINIYIHENGAQQLERPKAGAKALGGFMALMLQGHSEGS